MLCRIQNDSRWAYQSCKRVTHRPALSATWTWSAKIFVTKSSRIELSLLPTTSLRPVAPLMARSRCSNLNNCKCPSAHPSKQPCTKPFSCGESSSHVQSASFSQRSGTHPWITSTRVCAWFSWRRSTGKQWPSCAWFKRVTCLRFWCKNWVLIAQTAWAWSRPVDSTQKTCALRD